MPRAKFNGSKDSSANLGFEAKLWLAADKLRNNMEAAEYKHVGLGLIFLKYISDSFEEHHAKLIAGEGEYVGSSSEDPDEYRAENIFWVPKDARWSYLQANAKQPTIGKIVDDAMVAIECDNPRLKGVLPKDYARPALDKAIVGRSIDDTYLFYALLNSASFLHSKVQSSGHGTDVLPTDFLERLEFVVPPPDKLDRIVQPLRELNSRITINEAESRTLATLRDTLLPKLLSGDLSAAKPQN
jgi:hypothetical protein